MGDGTFWIVLSILIALILIGVLTVFLVIKKRKKTPPDYYTFFIMGIIWLPVGAALNNYALIAMGFIFALVGILNKDKWKSNKRSWEKLDKQERILVISIGVILGILFLAGIIVFLLMEKGII